MHVQHALQPMIVRVDVKEVYYQRAVNKELMQEDLFINYLGESVRKNLPRPFIISFLKFVKLTYNKLRGGKGIFTIVETSNDYNENLKLE